MKVKPKILSLPVKDQDLFANNHFNAYIDFRRGLAWNAVEFKFEILFFDRSIKVIWPRFCRTNEGISLRKFSDKSLKKTSNPYFVKTYNNQ